MSVSTRAHSRITRRFINEERQDVVIRRRERIATPAGGKVWRVVGDLPKQDGRQITTSDRGVVRTSVDGRTLQVDKVLIMMPEADVKAGDLWLETPTLVWEVISVSTDPRWRTSVEIARHGS